jgi:hypothetical protein
MNDVLRAMRLVGLRNQAAAAIEQDGEFGG